MTLKMKPLAVLLLSMSFAWMVGCGDAAQDAEKKAESAGSSLRSAEENAAEEDSVDEAALLAAAEAGQEGAYVYTVQDGVVYYNGVEVTEEQTSLDFSNLNMDDYSFLQNYSWVEALTIEDKDLEDLSFLQYCPNLKQLYITCSASDFDILKELPRLNSLDICDSKVTNLDFLSGKSMVYLGLHYCESLTDISALENMTSLSILTLFCSTELEDFSVLPSLTGLNFLSLGGTSFDDLSLLEGLSSLSQLSITGCDIKDYTVLADASYTLTSLQSNADEETVEWLETIFPDCEFTS